jgi:redox-sensing transcriptional repressor
MIVVPVAAAQEAADRLVAAGVEGIVNFAPVTLLLPPHVQNVGVDLAIELEQLSFAVTNTLAKSAATAEGDEGIAARGPAGRHEPD